MLSKTRGATLFEVPFATAMSDSGLPLLTRTLDLSTRMHPKMSPRHDSPGLARLDHHSGLQTWGHPAAQSIHEWHVLAAGAAHQLDPTVTIPPRLSASSSETAERRLGRAANKRLTRIRRRIVGLR